MHKLNTVRNTCFTFTMLISLATGTAQADQEYDLKQLNGRYAFSAYGTLVPPAVPSLTPAAAVGIFSFDGEGGCEIEDTINMGGTAVSGRISLSCEYTVESNGMGNILAFFDGDPEPTPLEFVIIDKKNIRFIRVDLGVAEGVATIQHN